MDVIEPEQKNILTREQQKEMGIYAGRKDIPIEEANVFRISREEIDRINKLPYKLNQHIRELLFGAKWAIKNKNTSAVFVIDGRSGMGKSTLATQIGGYIQSDFSIDNLYFTPEEFLRGLADAKHETCHVFDEALLVSSRATMSLVNRMVVQAMAMIRSKRIVVIFCANSIFDLDKNLALHRADALFHVYGDSMTDRGKVMAFFKGADGWDRIKDLYLNGKKYYSYAKPKSNFQTTFPSYFAVNEDDYEKKKQKGINLFLRKGSNLRERRLKVERLRLWKYLYDVVGLTLEKLSEITGIDLSNISKELIKTKNMEIGDIKWDFYGESMDY